MTFHYSLDISATVDVCGAHTCHKNAECDSLNYCACHTGYYGNGLICISKS